MHDRGHPEDPPTYQERFPSSKKIAMGDRRVPRERVPPNRIKASGSASAARNNSAPSRKSAPAAQAVPGSSKRKRANDLDSLSDVSRVLVSQISTPPRPNSRNLPANEITAENDTSDHDGEQDEELEESQNLDEDNDEEEEEEEEDDDAEDEILKVGASKLAKKIASPQIHITST